MQKKKGFTLVELVLVIALLGILAFTVGPPLFKALQGYAIAGDRRATLAEARAAMDRMVREIRLIESQADVVNVNSATSFQCEYPNNTSITYDLNNGNLRRNANVLASNISALAFTYYDEDGDNTNVAANVRRIQIQFTKDAPGTNHGSITLRTNIFLRNTGNNYSDYETQ